ncbi:hypothetical protein [Jannaschia seohaensis]|uniref:Uncharacterized protein n=1 Tax=Jannaschia seohaensis TaxID=475081 RepID=A0A2Y9A3P9_9RHOB|nr:hypothetical protein [Jannaschia seohaensis]PWJ22208.1 hypothetical protein BCF38_101618 [Jannaschia seohaensis]SSA38486.1 hypothetical protein SAMN05421539_101618 [Jannaschia seohaensis]
MSQLEPVIWQVSSPPARIPVSDRELRQAYRAAAQQAEGERVRGARERLHTLGITTAVCCGLVLNLSNVTTGLEISIAALKGLSGLL